MAKSEKARTAERRIAGMVQQDACPIPHPIGLREHTDGRTDGRPGFPGDIR